MTFDVPNWPKSMLPRINPTPPLLTRQKVSVSTRGEIVVITIGNSEICLHYSEAIPLSQWIRVRAKKAKALAGDKSRHWSALANLEHLEG